MDLFTKKQEILIFYQALIKDSTDIFSEDKKAYLKEQKDILETEKFSIVVAGRFSAGKSRLINAAFLRADILPYKNEPVTCHPVHIVYGQKPQLVLRDDEGGVKVIAGETNDEEKASSDIKDALERFGAHYGGDHDRYSHIELQWNDSDIFKNGIALVDTIGTEDIDDRYVQQTFAEMEKGSAVIFLVNIKQAGTGTEQIFLEKYMSSTKKKLFIVLNRADTLDSDEDRKDVLADFKQRFIPFFSAKNIRVDDRIFIVSAKTGLGVEQLRQRLMDFIANDRVRELLIQHTSGLKNGLSALHSQIKTHLNDLENKLKGDEQALRETQKRIVQIESELNRRQGEVNDMKNELIEEAENNIEDEIKRIKDYSIESIRASDTSEAQEILTDILERLVQASDRVGKKLQQAILNGLDSRLRKWTSHLDVDELESRIIGTGTAADTVKMADNIGKVGGCALMSWGAIQAFSVYTNAATIAANTGAYVDLLIWLYGFGGAASAPVLASVTAAAPWIACGLLVAGISRYICKQLTENKIQEFRMEMKTTIRELLKKSETELKVRIDDYVNDQVDNYLKRLKDEINIEKQQLESVIHEKDIQVLLRHVEDNKAKHTQLNEYMNRLNKLVVT